MGKTRLVTEFAGQAGRAGAVVLAGGCLDVGDGILPYAPVMEALRSLAATVGADELDAVLGGARPELARLVPELGTPAPVAGRRPRQGRLFELLLGVRQPPGRAGPGPAGGRGPALGRPVHPRPARASCSATSAAAGWSLVLTYRTDELHPRHPLRPFLAEVERRRRAERLELPTASTAPELAGLLARHPRSTRPRRGWSPRSFARAAGQPVLRRGAARGRRRRPGGPAALGPARPAPGPGRGSVRAAAQQVLRVAAAAGSRVDHRAARHRRRHAGAAAARGCCARRSPATLLVVRRAAARLRASGMPWSRRRSTTTCSRASAAALHAAYARALAGRRAEGRAGPADLGQLAFHW